MSTADVAHTAEMAQASSSTSQTVWERPRRFTGCPISTSKKLYDAILSFIPNDVPKVLSVDETSGVLEAQLQFFADKFEQDLDLWKLELVPKLPNQYLRADQIRGPSEVDNEFVANMRVIIFVCAEDWDQMKAVLDKVNKKDNELQAIIWLGTADMWTSIGDQFSRWIEHGFMYGTWERDVRADQGMGMAENQLGVIFHKDNETEEDWEWEEYKVEGMSNDSIPLLSESDEGLNIVSGRGMKVNLKTPVFKYTL